MSRSSYPTIRSYQDARDFIGAGANPSSHRNIPSIRATGFRFEKRDDGQLDVVVKQHTTDIIRYHPDGTMTLNSGGWRTYSTKERLNSLTPARIGQEKGIWYLYPPQPRWNPKGGPEGHGGYEAHPTLGDLQGYEARKAARVEFEDGVVIDQWGWPLHATAQTGTTERLKRKLDNAVSRYIRKYVREVRERKDFPDPSAGDCLYCQLTIQSQHTAHIKTGILHSNGELEDTTGRPERHGVDHLLSHVGLGEDPDELYAPLGSLAWAAFQRHGNPAAVWHMAKSAAARGETPSFLAHNLAYFFRQRKPAMLEELKRRAERQKQTEVA